MSVVSQLGRLPDEYLTKELHQPSGNIPGYLVMIEMARRDRLRQESPSQPVPETTLYEEIMTGNIRPSPPVPGAEGGTPGIAGLLQSPQQMPAQIPQMQQPSMQPPMEGPMGQMGLPQQEPPKGFAEGGRVDETHETARKGTEGSPEIDPLEDFILEALKERRGYSDDELKEFVRRKGMSLLPGAMDIHRRERGYARGGRVDGDIGNWIQWAAGELGVDPLDIGTIASYETGGTFDPNIAGPTTKWGTHRGLFQWGEPQAQKYLGGDFSVPSQFRGFVNYARDAGVQPGHGLMDIYSAVNAGQVGRYGASDAIAGGAPGTVYDKVVNQMAGHRQKAMNLLNLPDAQPFPANLQNTLPQAAAQTASLGPQASLNQAVDVAQMSAPQAAASSPISGIMNLAMMKMLQDQQSQPAPAPPPMPKPQQQPRKMIDPQALVESTSHTPRRGRRV